MRILVVHNYYGDYSLGGESQVAEEEVDFLTKCGHEVRYHRCTNDEFYKLSAVGKLRQFMRIGWNRQAKAEIGAILDDFKPDVMHVHNYRFMLSPSIFMAAKERGIRTVQTLHNYRLLAPCGSLLNRDARPCERCVRDHKYLRYLRLGCTGSGFGNRLMRYISFKSSIKNTFRTDIVDCYIVLTEFLRDKLLAAGMPEDKLVVKPNFIADPVIGGELPPDGAGAVCIGRIAEEKGVEKMLEAWGDWEYPLTIIGDGPLREGLQKRFTNPAVTWLGLLDHNAVMEKLKTARFLAFPSTCYEGLPMAVTEADALGIPTVAEAIGTRIGLVIDGENGFLYRSGDIAMMREKYRAMAELAPEQYSAMRNAARTTYLNRFTPEKVYPLLLKAYGRES